MRGVDLTDAELAAAQAKRELFEKNHQRSMEMMARIDKDGAELAFNLLTLRNGGWVVAVHNDYRQAGERHTFWLFTKTYKSGLIIAVKGEGSTDTEAVKQVMDEAFDSKLWNLRNELWASKHKFFVVGDFIAARTMEEAVTKLDKLIGPPLVSHEPEATE